MTRAARAMSRSAVAPAWPVRSIARAVRDFPAKPADARTRVRQGPGAGADRSANPPPHGCRTVRPRARARSAESRGRRARLPASHPDLFEKITGLFRAQIQKEKRRTALLKHGIQSIGHADVAHLRERAQKRLDAPDEVRVLRIEDANRGRTHAAAISCLNRTSGSKI